MKLLLKSTICLGLLLVVAFGAHAQDLENAEVVTTKITDSIFMLGAADGGNIGVCIGEDGVFIVDDQYAPLTERIQAAIAQLTDKPVQFVINTHWHGDHSGGNENFGKAGAIIVAQENSRKRLEADQQLGLPPHPQAATALKGLPKVTFDESINFYYNGETIRIYHQGPAHSDGDAMVFFEKSNVVHMGDVFVRYGFPYVDEPSGGNVNGLIDAVNWAIEKTNDETIIIPGHGQLSKRQDMIDFSKMVTEVRDRIQQKMNEGKSLAEIQATDPIGADVSKIVYNSILKTKNGTK